MAIDKLLITSPSPHAHSGKTTSRIMWTVVAVLAPAGAFAVYSFGLPAAITLIATIGSAVAFEALWQAARKQPMTVKDGSAFLTGLLLALNLPPSAPWWLCIVGGFVAMVLGKLVFGGLGQNPFNPALTARVFLLIAFPVPMTQWLLPEVLEPPSPESGNVSDLPRTAPDLGGATLVYPDTDGVIISDLDSVESLARVDVDMVSSASPLGLVAEASNPGTAAARFSIFNIFSGAGENGSLGEVSALILLLGGLALLLMRVITWHIPVAFLGSMAIFAGITNAIDPAQYAGPLFHLCAGGAMIGAFFMATDYVTSPMFPRGKILFGVGCGILTMVIRVWGGYPEGVSFAILLMNAAVPLIDRYTKPKKFGMRKLAAEGGKRAMGIKFVVPAFVLTLICGVAALALAAVHTATTPIIAEQERLFRLRSIQQSIPTYDNEPDQDVVTIEAEGRQVCVFRGRTGDDVTGVAFQRTQGGGYSGDITFLVGLTPEGDFACNDGGDARWVGLQVLAHAETPGLGANMSDEAWRRQFCGHDAEEGPTFWQVRKDGGQIDSLTGATITTRVVSEAIVGAMQFFQEHREEILNGEPGTCEE